MRRVRMQRNIHPFPITLVGSIIDDALDMTSGRLAEPNLRDPIYLLARHLAPNDSRSDKIHLYE